MKEIHVYDHNIYLKEYKKTEVDYLQKLLGLSDQDYFNSGLKEITNIGTNSKFLAVEYKYSRYYIYTPYPFKTSRANITKRLKELIGAVDFPEDISKKINDLLGYIPKIYIFDKKNIQIHTANLLAYLDKTIDDINNKYKLANYTQAFPMFTYLNRAFIFKDDKWQIFAEGISYDNCHPYTFCFGKLLIQQPEKRFFIDLSLESASLALDYFIKEKNTVKLRLRGLCAEKALTELLKSVDTIDFKEFTDKFNRDFNSEEKVYTIDSYCIYPVEIYLSRLVRVNDYFESENYIDLKTVFTPNILLNNVALFNTGDVYLSIKDDKLMLFYSKWCQRATQWSYEVGVDQNTELYTFYDWLHTQYIYSNNFSRYTRNLNLKPIVNYFSKFKLPKVKAVSKTDILARLGNR